MIRSIQFQFNSGIGGGIGIERFGTKRIVLKFFEFKLELKEFVTDLELNEKELSICYYYDAVKDILQTVGSVAVQAMVFNDQEQLDTGEITQITITVVQYHILSKY